jgi:hypothetical protein
MVYQWIPLEKFKAPRNQSWEHFYLCEIARFILWSQAYHLIDGEVHVGMDIKSGIEMGMKKAYYNVIDALGMDTRRRKIKGIEVKVSLDDFKSGFCTAIPLTYILCPANVVPAELVPKGIGLYYADMENLAVRERVNKLEVHGITEVKRAKKRVTAMCDGDGNIPQWRLDRMASSMAYGATRRTLFQNPWVEINERIWREETE